MLGAELDAIAVPANPLDVLSQQIVAICCSAPISVDDIERVIKRAWSYRDLSHAALEAVLDMLSGRYPSSDFADLRPLLSWDRTQNLLSPRRGAAMVTRLNAGTIPDRGAYSVHLGEEGPRVGELDEEMVFEIRVGDNITLGASTWRVEQITRDRVIVTPAPGESGRLPFWRGDGPGRPVELGRAIGAFVRKLGTQDEADACSWLETHTPLDGFAARNLAAYISDQKRQTGTLPTDRSITIERFRDELGDWRICILTPFGARIHAPWAMALQRTLGDQSGFEIQVMYTDDGIVLRFADVEELPAASALIPDPDEVEELITDQLAGTSLFAGLFRENAVRSLLLRRRRPGQRSPLWAQRLKAQNLLATVRQYPSFPIVIETYRQCMADVFDLPALKEVLRALASRAIQIDDVETRSASPFSRSLVFAYVAAYLYEQDAPLAERKAMALTLDRSLLAELLGQAELRDLIDREILAELEAELQYLADDYRARDADEVHDLLRRLSDLSAHELALRCTAEPGQWIVDLEAQRRAIQIQVAGDARWIAAEDAGLYRDALGTVPAAGLPDSFLIPVEQALEKLLRRYARHRGPFPTRDPAARYDLRPVQVDPVLGALEAAGVLMRGEIRPDGAELEWCVIPDRNRRCAKASKPNPYREGPRCCAVGPGMGRADHERHLRTVTRSGRLAAPSAAIEPIPCRGSLVAGAQHGTRGTGPDIPDCRPRQAAARSLRDRQPQVRPMGGDSRRIRTALQGLPGDGRTGAGAPGPLRRWSRGRTVRLRGRRRPAPCQPQGCRGTRPDGHYRRHQRAGCDGPCKSLRCPPALARDGRSQTAKAAPRSRCPDPARSRQTRALSGSSWSHADHLSGDDPR